MALLLILVSLVVYRRVTTFDAMRYASVQYSIVYQEFLDSSGTFYPTDGYPLQKEWESTKPTSGWTSGFFPGVLWNLAEYNLTRETLKRAIDVTAPVAPFSNYTDGSAVGSTIMSSFGNGYRLSKRPEYLEILVAGAHSLATRYSPIVRCTRS
jgi:hypothetical protein